MDDEGRLEGWYREGEVLPPAPDWQAVPPGPPIRGESKLLRITVGAVVNFVGLSLLYGVNSVVQFAVLAVICTAGVGAIPILFLCWLVGWFVLAVWRGFERERPTGATT